MSATEVFMAWMGINIIVAYGYLIYVFGWRVRRPFKESKKD